MHLKEMMVDILEQMEWEDHFLLARVEQLLIVAKFMRRVKIFVANHSWEEVNYHGLGFLPVELESFLREEGLAEWVSSTLEIFDHEPIFTKTKDRKALGHMNDFKNMVLYSRYEFDEGLNWHKVSSKLRETPMIIYGNFTNPHKIFSLYAKLKMNDFAL